MNSHSNQYEREVIATLRLVRAVVYGVLLFVGATLVLALAAGIVTLFQDGTSRGLGRGTDIHAPLKDGASLRLTTEGGATASVTVTSVERLSDAIRVEILATGLDGVASLPTTWRIYLTDNAREAMSAEMLGPGRRGATRYRLTWLTTSPAGASPGAQPRFLHVNPDESHGDMYFDVQP